MLSAEKRIVGDEMREYKYGTYINFTVVVLDVGSPKNAEVFLTYTFTEEFHLNVQRLGNSDNFDKYVFLEMQNGILTIFTKNVN